MPKLRTDPIVADDLAAFVGERSDFAFEMQVVVQLRELGFECSHAGTYRDPVTDKVRQFDIRATREDGLLRLALAVECKNLQENCPLLLSAVPRTPSESFHDLIHTPRDAIRTSVRTLSGDQAFYPAGEMVAKRTDQVGRMNDGTLSSDGQATFEKIGQAVNSCQDLVRRYGSATSQFVTSVVPVLLVPRKRLWQVEYDADGTLKERPLQVQRATLFLDHTWSVAFPGAGPLNYRLSHIECLTSEALPGWVGSGLRPGGLFPATG